MSTDGSDTSSQIRRFGLYRTIDAKTEEFLKLSKKRQIKQGCACAAISTVITVAVVIIVLLIYEYMIAARSTVVQNNSSKNGTNYIKTEVPMADRLDGNFFGVDQDYYEKIPILINDLQESLIDLPESSIRSSRKEHRSISNRLKTIIPTIANKFVRRTSPRPFIYEYRGPYPMPFTKTTSPKQWLEQYRNTQRLKNLRNVVKYLERTLNAKFSDMYLPSAEDMTFSEVYVPYRHDNNKSTLQDIAKSVVKNNFIPNHNKDPLLIYKPNNPGEINLLADGLRFAPTSASLQKNSHNPLDLIQVGSENCKGSDCLQYKNSLTNYFLPNLDTRSTPIISNRPKTFTRTNFPSTPLPEFYPEERKTEAKMEYDKIFITTSKPVLFQFRRKHSLPIRRVSYNNRKLRERKSHFTSYNNNKYNITENDDDDYLILKKVDYTTNYSQVSSTPLENNRHYQSDESLELNTLNTSESILPRVEDYHMGSTGVIPVASTSNVYPIFTPFTPPENVYTPSPLPVTTNPPDIIKFSPEDAKVPVQYINLGFLKSDTVTESNNWKHKEIIKNTKVNNNETDRNTLIIKLRNIIENSTEESLDGPEQDEFIATTEQEVESTTATYVPQINGHYRNVKNKTLLLLQENSEKYRKKRLENLLSIRNSTYVPMYVEIVRKRN